MNKGNLVLMHGYICSLKTTISHELAKDMGMARLETKQLGPIGDQYDKAGRYALLTELAEVCVKNGVDVILDGTFGEFECRKEIYKMAESLEVEDIVIIHCYCDDESKVWDRMHDRKEKDTVCVLEWINQTHIGLGIDKYDDTPPSIINVDTNKYIAKVEYDRTIFCRKIGEKLEKIIKRLSKP